MAKMARQGGGMSSQSNNPYFQNVQVDQRMNFKIPPVPASNQFAYYWARREIVGVEDVNNVNAKLNKDPHLKWIPVKPGEIPELDHLERGGYILYNDLMLMKSSKEMARYKQEWKIWKAKEQIKALKQDAMNAMRDRSGRQLGKVQDTISEEPDFE